MKLAIIADIHSNAPALEAVLADIDKQQPDLIVQLGDAFNGPVDPAGVARLLREREMIHIRGNGERMVLSEDPVVCVRSAAYAKERLSADDLKWIAGWPTTLPHAEFFACHGTPDNDESYLVEHPLPEGGMRLHRPEELELILKGIDAPLILCAHSHLPQWVPVNERQSILNPGSVGLPAYRLEKPFPHVMETGSPEAHYAIAEKTTDGWRATHHALPYDVDHAAKAAEETGDTSWAQILRTGYAP